MSAMDHEICDGNYQELQETADAWKREARSLQKMYDVERAKVKALTEANTRASAELRHATKGCRMTLEHPLQYRIYDSNLIDRAIVILETATQETALTEEGK